MYCDHSYFSTYFPINHFQPFVCCGIERVLDNILVDNRRIVKAAVTDDAKSNPCADIFVDSRRIVEASVMDDAKSNPCGEPAEEQLRVSGAEARVRGGAASF